MLFEEIWSRNIIFICFSIKNFRDNFALTSSALIRTYRISSAALIAIPLFGISILELGLPLILLLFSLYLFGITLGLLVTAGLFRFGPSFENVAWASLFFIAPLGCIYYPVDILPNWIQPIALGLPLAHIFEETRNILVNQTVDLKNIYYAILLNLIYLFLAISIFYKSFSSAKKNGTLVNIGE